MTPNAVSEYESFADIYEVWTSSAASANNNLKFYVDTYQATEGLVVELGVGDGRIAIEAAIRGCTITGVDKSPAMLNLCRVRAARSGVLDRITLVEADFRDFEISEPAGLIALPYHSIGHLLTINEKRDAMRHVFECLRSGGLFVFDDFLMTPALIKHMREVQLRAVYPSVSGADHLLWVTSLVKEADQSIAVVTWEDILDMSGTLRERRYRRLSLTWLEPNQARNLLEEVGFTIEAHYGDFEYTPFETASANEQVWVARKPR